MIWLGLIVLLSWGSVGYVCAPGPACLGDSSPGSSLCRCIIWCSTFYTEDIFAESCMQSLSLSLSLSLHNDPINASTKACSSFAPL